MKPLARPLVLIVAIAVALIPSVAVTAAAWVDREHAGVTITASMPRPPQLTPGGCTFTQQGPTSWTVSLPYSTYVEYGRARWQLRDTQGGVALQESLTALPLPNARLGVSGLSGSTQFLTVWVTAGSEDVSWPSTQQTVRVTPTSATCELL